MSLDNYFNGNDEGQASDPNLEAYFAGQTSGKEYKDYLDEMAALYDNEKLPKESKKEKSKELGNAFIEKKASQLMDRMELQLPDANELATNYDQISLDNTLKGVYNSFADEEEFDRADKAIESSKEKAKADISRYNIHMTLAKNDVARRASEQGVLNTVNEAVEFMFSPTYGQTAMNAISEVFPDFNHAGRLTVGQSFDWAAKQIVNAPPEEQGLLTRKLIKELEDRAGDFTDNELVLESMLSDFDSRVQNLSVGDTNGIRNVVDDVFGALELIGIGGVAKLAGKGIVNAGKAVIDKIPLGIKKGSVVDSASMTVKGQEKILNNLNNDEKLKELGTNAEEVVNDLVLPKMGDEGPANTPYVAQSLIDLEAKQGAFRRAKEDVLLNKEKLGTRIHDSVIVPTDEGYEYTLRLGKKSGQAYSSKESLKQQMKVNGFDDYEIEETALGFVAKVKGKSTFNLNELSALGEQDIKGGYWKALFGKATMLSDRLVKSSNIAAAESARVEKILKDTIKPYDSLWGKKKAQVAEVLFEGDRVGKEFTRDELISRGFNDKQILGYESVRKTVEKERSLKNHNLRKQAVDDGWKDFKGTMIKPIEDIDPIRNRKVFDLEDGAEALDKPKVDDNYNYFEILGKEGFSIGRVSKNSADIKELPLNILKKTEGYLPRKYTSPYFIKKVEPGVRPDTPYYVTAYTARSREEARAVVDKLKKETGEDYNFARAGELQGQVQSFDELKELQSQNLLYSSEGRRPSPLKVFDPKKSLDEINSDEYDVFDLINADRAIQSLVSSGATAGGVGKWVAATTKMWDKAYKKEFGSFNSFSKPAIMVGEQEKRYLEAKRLHDFISGVNGSLPSLLAEKTQGFRNVVADALYGKGRVANFVAKEVAGQSTITENIGKTFAFTAYLGLNPVRQIVMQASMIPTYFGVNGGGKYLMSGRFFQDMALITADTMKQPVKETARRLGIPESEAMQLIEGYRRSGLKDIVNNHAFTIGTLSDAQTAKTNALTQGLGKSVDTIKRIGFDVGLKADKRAAFLLSYNRFKTMNNGKIPKNQKDWEEVISFTETLNLNQNRTDILPTQRGVFGILTQFMSHQFKMSGRLLGLEGQLTKSERRRMALVGMATYGLSGYDIWNTVDRMLQEAGVDTNKIPYEFVKILKDGLGGFLVEQMFRAADDPDKLSEINTSSFSPTNAGILGITPDGILKVFEGTASLEGHIRDMIVPDAPALALPNIVSDTVKLGLRLRGTTTLPPEDILTRLGTNVLSNFPIYNQFTRFMIADGIIMKLDAKGSKLVEKTKGELVAQMLLGLPSADEQALRDAQERFYGEYTGTSEAGIRTKVQDSASKYAKEVLIPLLNSEQDVREKYTKAIEVMDVVNALNYFGLTEENRNIFSQTVFREIEKSGIMRSERFRDELYDFVASNQRVNNGTFEDIIRDAPISQEDKDIMLETLGRLD